MDNDYINLAIKKLQKVLGVDSVITSETECKNFEKTTFDTNQKVLGVLCPKNREEVQKCVRIANKYKIKLYPLSTGLNVGLGGTVPVKSNSFIMLLSKMNQIREFNEDLAYVTIEPGVTQGQLVEFLKSQGSNLILSPTGSLPETSVIGNSLERGDTRGPLTERAASICRLGVVLPDGSYVETGFGRFRNAKTSNLSKYGVGPDLTDFFVQSNFGIVTQLTLWLYPKTKYDDTILFTIETEIQLKMTLNKLAELKLKKVVSYVDIFNEYKILTVDRQFPWDLEDDTDGLKQFVNLWRKKRGIGKWNGIIVIRSISEEIVSATKKAIIKSLYNTVSQIITVKGTKFTVISKLRKILELVLRMDLRLLVAIPKSPIFKGIPYKDAFKSLCWRKKDKPPNNLDPIKDNCGVIWVAIAAPFRGEDIATCINIIKPILKEYSFEPNISLLGINERIITITVCIIYDRDVNLQDQKAMECHNKILLECLKNGYYPNRLGIHSMHSIPNSDCDFDHLIKKIKTNIDPNDIIAPGRYDFRHNWSK